MNLGNNNKTSNAYIDYTREALMTSISFAMIHRVLIARYKFAYVIYIHLFNRFYSLIKKSSRWGWFRQNDFVEMSENLTR